MNNPFSLEGKVILITGASSGIGRSIAIECSKMGASVFITARNEERLRETLGYCIPGDHKLFSADLNNDEHIELLVASLPLLDGIILNAGIIRTLPILFISRKSLDEMFNVNLNSAIILIQKLLKQKKIQKGGSICFISSVASNYVNIGNSLYSATKGAVNSFTKALALELASKNIRANAILPGFIETSILEKSSIADDQIEEHKKKYPLGRYGTPVDIAHLTIYLMSNASSWMTGSLLTIDGGYSIK